MGLAKISVETSNTQTSMSYLHHRQKTTAELSTFLHYVFRFSKAAKLKLDKTFCVSNETHRQ